jgi:TPR repeat protein
VNRIQKAWIDSGSKKAKAAATSSAVTAQTMKSRSDFTKIEYLASSRRLASEKRQNPWQDPLLMCFAKQRSVLALTPNIAVISTRTLQAGLSCWYKQDNCCRRALGGTCMDGEHTETQTAVSAFETNAKAQNSKLRVFISYSRDDLDFADQLDIALRLYGFETSLDRHAISGGEEWKCRLGNLIREADTVVFVLSPVSAVSDICAWEVEEAAQLGKRIIPVVPRALGAISAPLRLQDLNYIFFYHEPKSPGSGFGSGQAQLIEALSTDLDWLREHTRLLLRATEWDSGGRAENRLLSGSDIVAAKAWAAKRPRGAPEPTALHLEFIQTSEQAEDARLSAQRKQLEAMAQAQAEREAALHQAEEALQQAADAQRRRARIRNIAFVLVSLLALIAISLGWRAEQQRAAADEMLDNANNIIHNEAQHFDDATNKIVVAIFTRGAERGNRIAMANLGWVYDTGRGVPQDYAKAREWYEKAGDSYAMNSLGVLYENGRGVPQDFGKAREWYEKAVAADNSDAMRNLGLLYKNGWGVPQDYTKARECFEQAAVAGNMDAMNSLGVLYETVLKDYTKAREWYEKAAAGGNQTAMNNLGMLYENSRGVPQDYAKAREWYEKAAGDGDETARRRLELLPIIQAKSAGEYAKALRLQESFAEKREETETKRDGKPGKETAVELEGVAWYALLARDFPKALAASERAHQLFPEHLAIETNRAHALMFLGHEEEAKALYLGYKGKQVPEQNNETWDQVVDNDFAEFGKIGLNNPLIAEIEKQLAVGH